MRRLSTWLALVLMQANLASGYKDATISSSLMDMHVSSVHVHSDGSSGKDATISSSLMDMHDSSVHVHSDGSSGKELSARVKKRYVSLPYPRQDDIKAMWLHIMNGPEQMQIVFDKIFDGGYDFCANGMRVLSAGCGTGVNMVTYAVGLLAASQACKTAPEWEVVCYDLSTSSLDAARDKAQVGGFEKYVKFIQGDILEISPATVGLFDFIVSTGVLHHIADTMRAFKALQSVLRRGGGMDIMLYGLHGRQSKGLFNMQQLIGIVNRATGADNDEEKRLYGAATVLGQLPKDHPHITAFGDSGIWEGVADLYLHPHEKNFDPKGIYRIVRNLTMDGFAVTADDESCPAQLSKVSDADVHMGLKWGYPHAYSLDKVAPGIVQPGVLTPEQDAQAANLASANPPAEHKFYLFTPSEWRSQRFRATEPFRVPGVVHFRNDGEAWAGTGRVVGEVGPFGPPKSIDYNVVGRKNAKAYRKIGLPDMAKTTLKLAKKMHKLKGVTDPTSSGEEDKILLSGSIEVGGGVRHTITVYFGQTAQEAAKKFVQKHKLDPSVQASVENLVSGWMAQEQTNKQ
eukprot:TRINITY_DN873_c0_g2_i1.p1 TRINITY_DN873_c0_g2~~TRINITY_DN873_c0_g2_i1.p1  ORF type:complete len:571 (+),score=90.71 TRINITY_DN873_c0_g2_i1:61-1773(+)